MIHRIEKDAPPPDSHLHADLGARTEPAADDPRYFKLSKPFTVGDKTFDRLLVDSSELTGTVYFNLVGRFRRECEDIYRTSISKMSEDMFLAYVVAELNPPMVVEDVRSICFVDLPLLFIRVQGHFFGSGSESPEEK